MAKSKLTNNPLFKMLSNGLRDAKSNSLPEKDLLCIGFTDIQMKRMDLKRPRLIWFDSNSETFYDQGDSTLIKKEDWYKINAMTFKKNNPMSNLNKYVILTRDTLKEAENTRS
jgi:hypothetical protein